MDSVSDTRADGEVTGMGFEEEKAEMLELVQEVRDLLNRIKSIRKDRSEKQKAVRRLTEIRGQLKSFMRRYPNA